VAADTPSVETTELNLRGNHSIYWLSGILHRHPQKIAIINRVLVRESDWIHGAEVIRIEPDRVTLRKEGEEIIVRMGAA